MRELKFEVTDQMIQKDSACNFDGIVKCSKGYLIAAFSFNEEWTGTRRVACFEKLGEKYYAPIINEKCEIPYEALNYNKFKISVIGETADGNKRITTNKVGVEQCQ